jgi:hypothetical protein
VGRFWREEAVVGLLGLGDTFHVRVDSIIIIEICFKLY